MLFEKAQYISDNPFICVNLEAFVLCYNNFDERNFNQSESYHI